MLIKCDFYSNRIAFLKIVYFENEIVFSRVPLSSPVNLLKYVFHFNNNKNIILVMILSIIIH